MKIYRRTNSLPAVRAHTRTLRARVFWVRQNTTSSVRILMKKEWNIVLSSSVCAWIEIGFPSTLPLCANSFTFNLFSSSLSIICHHSFKVQFVCKYTISWCRNPGWLFVVQKQEFRFPLINFPIENGDVVLGRKVLPSRFLCGGGKLVLDTVDVKANDSPYALWKGRGSLLQHVPT